MWTRIRGLVSSPLARLTDAVQPKGEMSPPEDWKSGLSGALNEAVRIDTFGRTGQQQTLRTGAFVMNGNAQSAALVLSIKNITSTFLGNEGRAGPEGQTEWKPVYEPALEIELSTNTGQTKKLLLTQARSPNIFSHVVKGENLRPFFPDAENGRAVIKLVVDERGFPVTLRLLGPMHEASPLTATGYSRSP